jgi:hypothetical protein
MSCRDKWHVGGGPQLLALAAKQTKGAMSAQKKGIAGAPLLAFVASLGGCGGGGGDGASAVEPVGSAEPVLVADVASVTAVASGWAHSCVVDSVGQAWCWGKNEYGQLGCADNGQLITDADIPYIPTPCVVNSATPPMQLASIAAGAVETCGLDLSDTAICWGYGIPFDPVREPIGPTPVDTTERFALLRGPMGDPGMCGLSQSGARYCWGGRRDDPRAAGSAVAGRQRFAVR